MNTFFTGYLWATSSDSGDICMIDILQIDISRRNHPEVPLRKGILKYAANLQENTHAEV